MSEKIYIQEDGEKREATPDEVSQLLSDQETFAIFKAEEEAIRTSAFSKLAELGLTEEEIAAL
jgi:hypothetical protein